MGRNSNGLKWQWDSNSWLPGPKALLGLPSHSVTGRPSGKRLCPGPTLRAHHLSSFQDQRCGSEISDPHSLLQVTITQVEDVFQSPSAQISSHTDSMSGSESKKWTQLLKTLLIPVSTAFEFYTPSINQHRAPQHWAHIFQWASYQGGKGWAEPERHLSTRVQDFEFFLSFQADFSANSAHSAGVCQAEPRGVSNSCLPNRTSQVCMVERVYGHKRHIYEGTCAYTHYS